MKTKQEYLFDLTASGSAYNDRDSVDIVADVLAGAPTLQNIIPITGVKANNTLDIYLATVETAFQTGDCPSAGTQSTVLAPRNTTAVRLSDVENLCQDKIDKILPRVMSAGARNEDLGSFQAIYMDMKVKNASKQLEIGLWQGVSGGSHLNPNANKFDGYLAIAEGETASLGSYGTFSGVAAGTIIADIRDMWSNRDEDTLEMSGWTLFCGVADYSTIVTAIVNAFPGSPQTFQNIGNENELGHMVSFFPGLDLKIQGTIGFGANGGLFMVPQENLTYITDLEHDKEDAKIVYDAILDKMHFSLKMVFGPQYYNPKAVVYREKV